MSPQGELLDSIQIVIHADFLKAMSDTITHSFE
jgi:hypothetical protein